MVRIILLNLLLPKDAIRFVGGILKTGYWRFVGATFTGIAPLTLFIACIGKSTDALEKSLLWARPLSVDPFWGYPCTGPEK